MFTPETIRKEIECLAWGPVTGNSTRLLASLLYIQEHEKCLPSEEPDEAALYEWVDHMVNADGTTGPHWSRHEAEVIRAQYGITCDETEFYVTLNMMYSDYCMAAVQVGVSMVELYARMAEAFLKDPDARPGKLKRYYEYVAQHE